MKTSRNKRLLLNTICSLMYEVIAILCGFIVPRLILQSYGSETNGLVSSITQFLGVISFLELGVGTVVQTALYKPLSCNDMTEVNRIMTSSRKYFGKIALILGVYALFLSVTYPFFSHTSFNLGFTFSLIVILSIGSISEYALGMNSSILLLADQKGYLLYISRIISLLFSTIISYFLIAGKYDIHIVKLAASTVFLVRVLVVYIYVNRVYRVNWKEQYDIEPISQKWNGIAQHISSVILDRTDTIVLTLFATLSDVSIYSVYFLVVNGVKTLFLSMTKGLQSFLGDMWARGEKDEIKEYFSMIEWIIHTSAIWVFGVTLALLVPFVRIYTSGILDTDYIKPMFAILICIANMSHSLRLPYNLMILAAGHYKQTQRCYTLAAFLNISISIIMVKRFGLIGVAIGTLVAMTYQTLWMGVYNSKCLTKYPIRNTVKQFVVDILSFMMICFSTLWINGKVNGYYSWGILGIKVSVISAMTMVVVNLIVYKNNILRIMYWIKKKRARNT